VRTGNVVRSPEGNDLWIVTDVTDTTVRAVSFTHANSSGSFGLDDFTVTSICPCCWVEADGTDSGGGCVRCKGENEITRTVKGWKHATVVAQNVQEFIMQGFAKAMGITK